MKHSDNSQVVFLGTYPGHSIVHSVVTSKMLLPTNSKVTARNNMADIDDSGGTKVANSNAHTHEIQVGDYGTLWYITYGDTNKVCRKPTKPFLPWRKREADIDALKRHIGTVIRQHDMGSRTATARREAEKSRKIESERLIYVAVKEMTPKLTDEWGDAQI